MGIFKAAAGSVGGVMADQWLEIYTCDAMPSDVLAMRGVRKTSDRSADTKGDDEIISDGSLIIVADGQCAIAIDRGQAIGLYDKPGENTYHSDRSKSLFHKGGLKGVVKQSWERFGYGGVAAVYQAIMYLDLRERHSNPFAVTRMVNIKDRSGLTQMDLNVTMKGMFSFRIIDPLTFYQKICGNATGTVKVSLVQPQLQAELASALAVALGKLCSEGALSPADISERTDAISDTVAAAMTEQWTAKRGFAVTSLAISDVIVEQKGLRMVQELERDKALTDPTMAAAHLVGAQGAAMQSAAKNPAGSAGAVAVISTPQNASVQSAWRCVCGNLNDSKFCRECGRKRPI